MSQTSIQRTKDFLAICSQFKLGVLTTESAHPVSANLSETAKNDISAALDTLFQVDDDVINKYRDWVNSGEVNSIRDNIVNSLKNGGKLFFTGCGATGRLSIQLVAIWREFWEKKTNISENWIDRAFSVMAGGDFALIKSVEGFEDFTQFGAKQIEDLGISAGDTVFAITEGGETSFVIGTAWKGLEKGANVYFVYDNPDDILCKYVKRSREVIEEPRIKKINLTTGPMAITGSTRMQATSIQLCVMITILEMVVRELVSMESDSVPQVFLEKLEEMHATLRSKSMRNQLAKLVSFEESIYKTGHKNNYFTDYLGVDVLTDTTERSPTFCTPPFKKFDDKSASESWAFLFLPKQNSVDAWKYLLKREPMAVEWSKNQVAEMVDDELVDNQYEIVKNISQQEIYKFKIGLDGLNYRPINAGDGAVGIVTDTDMKGILDEDGFIYQQLKSASESGAKTAVIAFSDGVSSQRLIKEEGFAEGSTSVFWEIEAIGFIDEKIVVSVPKTDFLLNGITHVGAKMLLNAISTCTMVRLGRVMGNYMIYVVPSNLKLIDRSTRYITRLTGLPYEDACYLLFEVIEYVEPRMLASKTYPPVVGMSVLRAKYGIGNEEAEERINKELSLK